MSDIETKIQKVVAEQLDVDPKQVTENASFTKDLGADSLDQVEMIMSLEENFGVEIPDEKAEKLVTVGDVIKFIKEIEKEKSA